MQETKKIYLLKEVAMRNQNFLTSAILTSAICLLTVFAFTTEKAEAWGWFAYSDLCFEGEIKSPAGDVVCYVTLESVNIRTACDNINSNESSPECHEGEAHEADIEQTIYPTGDGTKEKKYALVDGCFNFDIFDHHNSVGHIHTCPTGSEWMQEIEGSGYIQDFVAVWECFSIKTGQRIGTGRDTCTWTGTVDPETCLPSPSNYVDPDFECEEELFGKKWTWE
jgi:hypothetical protein